MSISKRAIGAGTFAAFALSGCYVVPLFYLPEQWVARWVSIAHPARTSLFGYLPETWWQQPKRALQ